MRTRTHFGVDSWNGSGREAWGREVRLLARSARGRVYCKGFKPTGHSAFVSAPVAPVLGVKSVSVSGLLPLTNNCIGLFDHGYFGHEHLAVKEIEDWIITH